jgi:nucleoside-diphosphate-sugar epimerase
MARAVIVASAAAGAKLVVMDNLYMYGRVSEPMTEATLRNAQGKKGRLRVELEHLLLEAHRAGSVRVTIGRASDFYGPQANSAPMFLVVKPAIEGRKASWLGRLDAPHTLSYLPDVGWGLVTLAEREESLGEIWHLPAGEPLTGRQFIELVVEELGRPPRMGVIRRPMMVLAGLFSPAIWGKPRGTLPVREPFCHGCWQVYPRLWQSGDTAPRGDPPDPERAPSQQPRLTDPTLDPSMSGKERSHAGYRA